MFDTMMFLFLVALFIGLVVLIYLYNVHSNRKQLTNAIVDYLARNFPGLHVDVMQEGSLLNLPHVVGAVEDSINYARLDVQAYTYRDNDDEEHEAMKFVLDMTTDVSTEKRYLEIEIKRARRKNTEIRGFKDFVGTNAEFKENNASAQLSVRVNDLQGFNELLAGEHVFAQALARIYTLRGMKINLTKSKALITVHSDGIKEYDTIKVLYMLKLLVVKLRTINPLVEGQEAASVSQQPESRVDREHETAYHPQTDYSSTSFKSYSDRLEERKRSKSSYYRSPTRSEARPTEQSVTATQQQFQQKKQKISPEQAKLDLDQFRGELEGLDEQAQLEMLKELEGTIDQDDQNLEKKRELLRKLKRRDQLRIKKFEPASTLANSNYQPTYSSSSILSQGKTIVNLDRLPKAALYRQIIGNIERIGPIDEEKSVGEANRTVQLFTSIFNYLQFRWDQHELVVTTSSKLFNEPSLPLDLGIKMTTKQKIPEHILKEKWLHPYKQIEIQVKPKRFKADLTRRKEIGRSFNELTGTYLNTITIRAQRVRENGQKRLDVEVRTSSHPRNVLTIYDLLRAFSWYFQYHFGI